MGRKMSMPERASDDRDRADKSRAANRGTTPPFCRTIRAKRDASGGTDDKSVLLRARSNESERVRCCSGLVEDEPAKAVAVGAMVNATTAACHGFAEVAQSVPRLLSSEL